MRRFVFIILIFNIFVCWCHAVYCLATWERDGRSKVNALALGSCCRAGGALEALVTQQQQVLERLQQLEQAAKEVRRRLPEDLESAGWTTNFYLGQLRGEMGTSDLEGAREMIEVGRWGGRPRPDPKCVSANRRSQRHGGDCEQLKTFIFWERNAERSISHTATAIVILTGGSYLPGSTPQAREKLADKL